MTEHASAFEISQRGDVYIIRFNRRVSDRLAVERMNFEIHGLLEQAERPKLVIDFAEVSDITSAVLGVVMGINLKVCRLRGELRLCSVRPELFEVLALVKLDTILNIDPTLDEALARIE